MGQIIFRLFTTPGGHYVYDRQTNTVFAVPPEEWRELSLVFGGELNPEESAVVGRYQAQGLLQPSGVREIAHPDLDYMEHHLSRHMQQLTLQVTQQCNLRCGYCAYSGLYYNREHNSQRMSPDLARRAIDFFLAHSRDNPDTHISFYGGEPLLELELIRQCVAYARERCEGKHLTFGMTTNGTLLTDEVVDYLVAEDFQLSVSLDGSKREHDLNRRFRSGQGSFDLIMENLGRIKNRYPDYMARTSIMTVVSPNADVCGIMEFFDTEQVMADSNIIMNTVAQTGLKAAMDYDEAFNQVRRFEHLKLLLHLTGGLERRFVSDLVMSSYSGTKNFYDMLQSHTRLPPVAHHGGPCLAGVQRLFVSVDGRFFPCEKVSESAPCACLGHIDTGFDMERVKAMINLGAVTAEECLTCWNLPNCKICAASMELDEHSACYCKASKLAACQQEKSRTAYSLHEMAVLREMGYPTVESEGEA